MNGVAAACENCRKQKLKVFELSANLLMFKCDVGWLRAHRLRSAQQNGLCVADACNAIYHASTLPSQERRKRRRVIVYIAN
jgi:hypothetical protein